MTNPEQKQAPATAWYQKAYKGENYFFNHIEDGHSVGETPLDLFDLKWVKAKWQKQLGYLVDQGEGLPPKLVLPAKTKGSGLVTVVDDD